MTMMTMDRYSCEEVYRRLDDYVDHELSGEEMMKVEEHLRLCEWCARHYRFEAGVLEQLRLRLQRVSTPPGLIDRVSQAISQAQKADGN